VNRFALLCEKFNIIEVFPARQLLSLTDIKMTFSMENKLNDYKS